MLNEYSLECKHYFVPVLLQIVGRFKGFSWAVGKGLKSRLPYTGGPGTQCGRCALLHWSHSESCASGSPPERTGGKKKGAQLQHNLLQLWTWEKKNHTTQLCSIKVLKRTTTILVTQLQTLHKNTSTGRKTRCFTVEGPALPPLAENSSTCDVTASVRCLEAPLRTLTRSTTSVGSGVLLVLGGMSRGAGRTQSDCDGMFLMNLKLNKDKKDGSTRNKEMPNQVEYIFFTYLL